MFLLSGLVNAILFTTTRRIVPTRGVRQLFSRPNSSECDVESPKSILSFVTPFHCPEKVSTSPIKSDHEILVVPVTVPAPTLQKSRSGRSNVSRVSSTPTVASVYSLSSCESDVAPPLVPKSRPQSIRRSRIAPLSVRKKISPYKAPADVPEEATEWSDGEVGDSSHGSLHHSTNLSNYSLPSLSIPAVR